MPGASGRQLPRVWNGPVSHLEDDRADQSVDRPGERLRDAGSLKTPQHYPPFTEDGEEV